VPRTLPVGRIDVADAPDLTNDTVLTLEEAAALFKLPIEAIRRAAEEGDLPGRRFSGEWRFSRVALLTRLSQGERTRNRKGRESRRSKGCRTQLVPMVVEHTAGASARTTSSRACSRTTSSSSAPRRSW